MASRPGPAAYAVDRYAREQRLKARQPGRADPLQLPALKGSIGEGPNHSNFSDRSSVRIQNNECLQNFAENEKEFDENFLKY